MIPKIIHYCWYGCSEMPDQIKATIESWKVQCPDYEIKRWDEDNSPKVKYLHDALKHQKWAFAADYMRFYALYYEGGVYMDTDMYLIKPIDQFLEHSSFVGREDKYNAAMGIIGMQKGDQLAKFCIDYYDKKGFDLVHPIVVTRLVTPELFQYGYIEADETQYLTNGLVVYQSDYFYPIHYTHKKPFDEIFSAATPNTYGIHWGCGSWGDEFGLLGQGKYKEGFTMACSRIKRNPFLPLRYYMKLVKYLGNYIGIWHR